MPVSFIFAYAHLTTQRYRQRRVWRAQKVLLLSAMAIWKIYQLQRAPLWSMSHTEKANRPLHFVIRGVQHFAECFKQRIAWETLLQLLQLLSLPWSHYAVPLKIVTFVIMGKEREHKEGKRKGIIMMHLLRLVKGIYQNEVTRSGEIRPVVLAISELCLSEGIR